MSIAKNQCNYCEKWYPENDFGVALTTATKVYRRRKCRHCYRSTKNLLREKYFLWINEYKQNRGCVRCGVKDARVLDFHHKNEKNKLFTIGYFRHNVGFDRIKKEVKKCEVICANCHRVLHWEKRRQ